MKKLLSVFFIIVILLITSILPVYADSFDVVQYTEAIINKRCEDAGVTSIQALINSFASSPATGEEWYVMSIRNGYTDINYSKYRNALKDYIQSTEVKNATTREFNALVYLAVGGDAEDINNVIDESVEKLGIMSRIYALHLLNNGASSENYTKESVIELILSLEKENGGWSITGNTADPDATAMAIQALAPYYESNENVKEAIDRAISVLSDLQKEEGYFYSYGNPNPESAAQVLLALASLGIDGLKDERFIKNGNTLLDGILKFKLDDGTFAHILDGSFNQTTTNQVLYCLTSYNSYLQGGNTVYILDELVEPELKEDEPGRADSELNIKTLLYIAIAVIALAWCVILIVKKTRSLKKYMVVLIVFVLSIFAVSTIKIQSKEDYYQEDEIEEYITCTLSVRCDTVAGQKDYIPENGVILDFVSIKIPKDGTAYDQIVAAAKTYQLQLDHKSGYISGINYIYEFDFGDLSGWMFKINGEFASVGAGDCKLSDNDYVEWVYTTNLGEDVGGGM